MKKSLSPVFQHILHLTGDHLRRESSPVPRPETDPDERLLSRQVLCIDHRHLLFLHPSVSKNRPKAAFVKMLFNYLPGACVCTSNHLIKVVRRINTVAKRITVPYAPADLFPITEHLLIVGNTSSIALIGYLLLCNLPLFILFVLESRLVGIRS